MLPSEVCSVRAISAPPSRPEIMIFTPLAPDSMVVRVVCFMMRRKGIPSAQLISDTFGDQLGIAVRVLYFENLQIDVSFRSDDACKIFLELLNLDSALSDHHSGSGCVQMDGQLVATALDLDLRHSSRVELVLDEVADLLILNKLVAELLFEAYHLEDQLRVIPSRRLVGLTL